MCRHVLVTGANGYLGSRLVSLAVAQGLYVTALGACRHPGASRLRSYQWRLGEDPAAEALTGSNGWPAPDAVVHLAHVWRGSAAGSDDANIAGSVRLIDAVRASGIKRFVFASSVSASPGALNRYGRVKWAVEQKLEAPFGVAARIGLVYGGPERSQWGTLCRLVTLCPVLPMLDPHKGVQPIHLDEAAVCLLALADLPSPRRTVYGLGVPEPVQFGRFLRLLAEVRFARKLFLVPVSSRVALALIRFASRIPILPHIDEERVLGLAGLPVIDTESDLRELGVELRPLEEGLANPAAVRRRLLEEAWIVLSAVLGRSPNGGSLRRYMKAAIRWGDGLPVPLPPVRWWPALLRMFEPVGRRKGAGGRDSLSQRLHLAMLVAESGEGARDVYAYPGESRSAAIARTIRLVLVEALLMPFRLVAGRFYR